MKTVVKNIVIAGTAALLIANSAVAESSTVLAEFGEGQEVTLEEFSRENPTIASWYGLGADADAAEQNLESMVFHALLAKEARRVGLDKEDPIKTQVDKMMASAYLGKVAPSREIVIDEKMLTRYYAQNRDKFLKPTKLKLSHILVASEADIAKVQSEIKSGSFESAAKKYSIDSATASKGGDLGRVTPEDLIPELWNGVKELRDGDLSEAIKSPFGYHLARMDRAPFADAKPYEEVKNQIYREMLEKEQREKLDAMKAKLFDKYDVELHKDALRSVVEGRSGGNPNLAGPIATSKAEADKYKQAAQLKLITETIDFGMVKGAPVQMKALALNTADEDLIVQKIASSCNCITAKVEPRKIAPGQTAELILSFNPKLSGQKKPGNLSKIVVIDSTDKKQPRKFIRVDAYVDMG